MSSHEYDLDLDSYSLEDLLSLFKIELPLTGNGVSSARRIAYMTHPDKSGLDREVFIFFKTAFNKLESLYKVQGQQNRTASEKYEAEMQARNAGLESFAKSRDFGSHFNKLFEECVTKPTQSQGHGEWLAATEDKVDGSTQSDLAAKKREQRELAVVRTVEGWSVNSGTSLLEEDAVSTCSGSLQYDDLRRAYTETLIPVTEEEDFLNRKRFSSVEELRNSRQTDVNTDSFAGHEKRLANERRRANLEDMQMAYQLQEADEIMRSAREKAETRLLQIRGK